MTSTALLTLHRRYAATDNGPAREIGLIAAGEQAMRQLNSRIIERAVAGGPPAAEGNITKLLSAEHAQRATELGMRIASLAAVAGGESGLVHEYLFARALTIAGGTSEVSRNVIAERILGLPREIMPS